MLMNAKSTLIVQSTDEHFTEALYSFLSEYCEANGNHAAVFELDDEGTKKALDIIKYEY